MAPASEAKSFMNFIISVVSVDKVIGFDISHLLRISRFIGIKSDVMTRETISPSETRVRISSPDTTVFDSRTTDPSTLPKSYGIASRKDFERA